MYFLDDKEQKNNYVQINNNYALFLPVSTFTKGEQMVPVLNDIGTHCAVLGNHDFGKFQIKPNFQTQLQRFF